MSEDRGKTYLVTGAAGFIGFHVSRALLEAGGAVTGFDSLNDYYDVNLKRSRLALLRKYEKFRFIQARLEDKDAVRQTFSEPYDAVIHLAAQAGVRYSLENPEAYISSNLVGFFNILEAVKNQGRGHLLFASSSSVYGKNTKLPFSVDQKTDRPVSLYAATKKSNELLAFSYSDMYRLAATAMRFFTVYGPYGRPDMAVFKFARAILAGEPVQLYNHGDMYRDFTFVDDVAQSVVRLIGRSKALAAPDTPYQVYNIGNSTPVHLGRFVEILEEKLGRAAKKEYLPMQSGDVYKTCADPGELYADIGFTPQTPLERGLGLFVEWYKEYYGIGPGGGRGAGAFYGS